LDERSGVIFAGSLFTGQQLRFRQYLDDYRTNFLQQPAEFMLTDLTVVINKK